MTEGVRGRLGVSWVPESRAGCKWDVECEAVEDRVCVSEAAGGRPSRCRGRFGEPADVFGDKAELVLDGCRGAALLMLEREPGAEGFGDEGGLDGVLGGTETALLDADDDCEANDSFVLERLSACIEEMRSGEVGGGRFEEIVPDRSRK